ncbi:MAG: hypothetical protein K6T29_07625 [Peptococcaceae bacterium]|nr:hypothetical protein [Peptococcaceae bacterium]
MGETRIIVISRRWPLALWQKLQQGLGLAPGKAGRALWRDGAAGKEKRGKKKR